MQQRSIVPSLVIVAGLALGLTGCGDDGLSSGDLRSKADEICKRVASESKQIDQPKDLATLEAAARQLVEISERGLKDLRALDAPSDDEATMKKLTGLIASSDKHLLDAADKAKAGDDAGATDAVTGSTNDLAEFESVAKAAGFEACGIIVTGEAADAAADDGVADGTDGTDGADGATTTVPAGLPALDLGTDLNPIPGYTYEPLPDEAKQALLDSLNSSEEVTGVVQAVGTTLVTNEEQTSALILLGLKRELAADETQALVNAMTAGGSNVESRDVVGYPGWAYTSADGQQGFVTVRRTVVLIALSDTPEHLGPALAGLLTANPDL